MPKTYTKTYRIAFGVGFAGVLLLGWVSGAVGIIGSENNSVNLIGVQVSTKYDFYENNTKTR